MNSVYVLKRNNVPGFENIKFINNKRKPPNFKKLLTNAEIGNEKAVVKNAMARVANVANYCYCLKNVHLKCK